MKNAKNKHLSFHTPGHKNGAWDITELSFSDNLSSPQGCIKEAEKEIAALLGASKSFILTDGSTSGILSMLYAAKMMGVKKVAFPVASHKSVFNGCKLLGLTPLVYNKNEGGMYEVNEYFHQADALLLTSPSYYGNIPNLRKVREYCDREGKLFLLDGAHGGHLHFDEMRYAGRYADLWVDGVHKSLPAFTQGAVVSARTERLADKLREGVDIFRTTSPSYPIMASVEYAVKYPRNEELEKRAWEFQNHPRIINNDDWTKVCAVFGENAFAVEKILESEGIFAEFCDGNVIVFYLSPATELSSFEQLKKRLKALFIAYPNVSKTKPQQIHTPLVSLETPETEWVKIEELENRICADNCGMFPPCVPLVLRGERISRENIELLKKADNVFGVVDGKVLVFKNEEK